LPVVSGKVIAAAAEYYDIGSSQLTMEMTQLLHRRFPDVTNEMMTWCRDLKENFCYVAPPLEGYSLRERLARGNDFGLQPVEVELPYRTHGMVEIAAERVLIPEILFERHSIPSLIARAAEKTLLLNACSVEEVRALLRQIVIVGGTADFPGMRPRTEFEVRALLQTSRYPQLSEALASSNDVFVLNPPLGVNGPLASPRFVPLVGGCVRAASSCPLESWDSREDGASLSSVSCGSFRMLPGFLSSVRHRLPALLNASLVFRTGGGGGEDDNLWDMFLNQGSDEQSESAAWSCEQGSEADEQESQADEQKSEVDDEPQSDGQTDDALIDEV